MALKLGRGKAAGLPGPVVGVFMGRHAVESGRYSPKRFCDRMGEFAEVTGIKLDSNCVVHICRGTPRCYEGDAPCKRCYRVRHDDRRTVGEIMRTVQTGS
jgi:hypothetical protein